MSGLPEALALRLRDIFEGPDGERAAAVDALQRQYPEHAAAIVLRVAAAESTLDRIERDEALLAGKPSRIGGYRILGTLGEGGMGTVYLAVQEEPVRRRVALKVIKLGMDTRQVIRRFEAERQALAIMEHSNIAKVLEAGVTEDGRPFFAMECVAGVPITDYCDARGASLSDRLQLYCSVCAGVQHAHHKGVIHRDLKPSNVLVADEGGEPTAKIIDFGLARATTQDGGDSLLTRQGQLVGTPEYASPEQAGALPLDVDTRTDVYSLGVMLYELLTGCLPFAGDGPARPGVAELQRRIREEEPEKPSTRASGLGQRLFDVARRRRLAPPEFVRQLRGDLDAIVMRAMEKDRARRYPTAIALSDDVQRFLRNEPVLATPPTLRYRLWKFLRRYRGQAAAAAAGLLAVVGGLVIALVFYADAKAAERKQARSAQEAREAKSRFRFLTNVVKLEEARRAQIDLYPTAPQTAPALSRWLSEEGEPLVALRPELAATLAELEAKGTDDEADRFLHATLTKLVADLEAFEQTEFASVRARFVWASTVRERTIGARTDRWEETIAGIARSPLYGGLKLQPQLGLVPLGMDPRSGLWEFAHLWSSRGAAVEPKRDPETARLEMGDDTGVVFVLLPPGQFVMGAQRERGRANFDRLARDNESTVRPIRVEAFFLSKYEMTQGQWRRLSGGDVPSYFRAGQEHHGNRIEWRNPVEQINFEASLQLLQRCGLGLPTEMQWEYACRGGTSTPWFTGATAETLAGFANIADRYAKRSFAHWSCEEWVDDGHAVHAPVGSYRANPFGLHDMHGNVWEWCRGDTRAAVRPVRGGSFMNPARAMRAAYRGGYPLRHRYQDLGLRPIRRIMD